MLSYTEEAIYLVYMIGRPADKSSRGERLSPPIDIQ